MKKVLTILGVGILAMSYAPTLKANDVLSHAKEAAEMTENAATQKAMEDYKRNPPAVGSEKLHCMDPWPKVMPWHCFAPQ